jgi:1-acyl-sn-glycerol-3-phosphate acyltransferase
MSAILHHPLRVLGRSLWLAWQFAVATADYLLTTAFRKPELKRTRRGQWLQRNSRRILRVLKVEWRSEGPLPQRGLLVTNHLGYMDILVIAAITPAAFVSKSEIKNWPVFGFFSRLAGTVFIERARRADVSRAGAEIKQALDGGALLVLFAEGTSSDGETVLPFKSALLEPVIGKNCPVTAGLISYSIADGDAREDIYYWGDMTLVPHIFNLIAKRSFSACVTFAPVSNPASDRKELARQLHAEVLRMKQG